MLARDNIGLPLTDAKAMYEFVKDSDNCDSLLKLAKGIISRSTSRQAAKFIVEVFGNGKLSLCIHSVEYVLLKYYARNTISICSFIVAAEGKKQA